MPIPQGKLVSITNKEDDMTDELMVDVTAEKRKPECKRI
jgi:hypothetical protein